MAICQLRLRLQSLQGSGASAKQGSPCRWVGWWESQGPPLAWVPPRGSELPLGLGVPCSLSLHPYSAVCRSDRATLLTLRFAGLSYTWSERCQLTRVREHAAAQIAAPCDSV